VLGFTFVILHYITIVDTIECVESILKNLGNQKYNVIIVDNGSPDGSGKLLYQKYLTHNNVNVVLLDQNLGFAKGLNVGYLIGKYIFASDFVILLNNDTIITQEDFLERINQKFKLEQFDVLGPDIISLNDGGHQNPARLQGYSIKELIIFILHILLLLLLNYLRVEDVLRKIKRRLIGEKDLTKVPSDHDLRNVQLHGSCLIFSPKYVNRFNGLCSKTFMYMEEDILFYQAQTLGLLCMYTPEIAIFHKEDSSTNAAFDKERKKRRFQYINILKSSMVLLKFMSGHKN
jgi:GT2 family glycosyltransferase